MSPREWETLYRAENQWRARAYMYREFDQKPDMLDRTIRYVLSVLMAIFGER